MVAVKNEVVKPSLVTVGCSRSVGWLSLQVLLTAISASLILSGITA